MTKQNLLVLRLEGALQSWGESSKWDHRDSSPFPTKSGIIGLLGCAMGMERNDERLVELDGAITMAVRADRHGTRLVDFQTVTGFPLRIANGKPRSNGNTIISSREYLQDACFTVFLDIKPAWREKIIAALKAPIWAIYLGRKNCIPSSPVMLEYTNDYVSLMDAVQRYPAARRSINPMEYEIDEEIPELLSYSRSDKRVSSTREFSLRRVWRGTVRGSENVSIQN